MADTHPVHDHVGGLLAGKRGLVLGVANNRSIAWGIAKSAAAHGAKLAFTYQGDALKKRVEPLARELDAHVVGHCDVTDPASIDAVFAATAKVFPEGIDFVVHCIAFSDKDELTAATSRPRRRTSPSRSSSPATRSRRWPSGPRS